MDNSGNFYIEPVASRTRARAGSAQSNHELPNVQSMISGCKRKPRPTSSTIKPKPANSKVNGFPTQPLPASINDSSSHATPALSSSSKRVKHEDEVQPFHLPQPDPSDASAQMKNESSILPDPELVLKSEPSISKPMLADSSNKMNLKLEPLFATADESQDSKPVKSKSSTGAKKKRAKKQVKAEVVPEITPEQLERRKKKAEMILQKLTEVYPEAPKGFLDHTDAFTLLCAVVLSAQCTDAKVNAVTPELFAAAPTPQAMIDLGIPRIKELISSIGLTNSKAKYLHQLSTIIVEQHGGNVPGTLEELENLSGVGHKTASVVASQFFGVHAFPVDTHIHRLACRWGIGDARSVKRTEAALKRWFSDPTTWQDLHTRIIKFGREYCPAQKHNMEECPICSFAATTESRRANATGRKFVAALKHKDPYQIYTGPVSSPHWSSDER